jgi:hypothetical protein
MQRLSLSEAESTQNDVAAVGERFSKKLAGLL